MPDLEETELIRLKKAFVWIAYVSLLADIAIAVVMLAYVNTKLSTFLNFELVLGYVLTAIVLISAIVFVAMISLSLHIKYKRRPQEKHRAR